MLILTVYREVLLGTPSISSAARGGVHIARVEQGARRPNVLLKLGDSGEGMSHQGPSGLRDAEIVVTARADTDRSAGELGEAIRERLNGWAGIEFGLWVQLTEAMSASSGYDEGAKVFEHVSTYTAHYRKVA